MLADLDDTMERELARGIPLWRAKLRYVANVCGSALSLRRARTRRVRLPVSLLDFKLGFRLLVKQPVLSSVVVFALAIGIPAGLSPVHFYSALLAPPPFEEADRLLVLRYWNRVANGAERRSLHDFIEWRQELTTFEDLGAARSDSYNLITDDGRVAPVRGAAVTASTFDLLRAGPLLGRTLIDEDEVIGAPAVVVIGYDIWRSRLTGDSAVVGKSIRIGGVPHTVVGVMPEGFLFPLRDQLWLPFRANVLDYERGEGPGLWIVGRLSAGISIEDARAELTTIGQRMGNEFPDTYGRLRAEVVPFTYGIFGMPAINLWRTNDFYGPLMITLLVLAIVCVNVSMLILARTVSRTGEIAVRTALGASRARVVSQLFVESLLLALVAAGLGLALGDWVANRFNVLDEFLPLPYWVDFGVNGRTVFWGLSLAVFSAVIAGVVPALRVTGRGVGRSLQRVGATGTGMGFGVMSSALIVADVALAVGFLTIGAGLVPSTATDAPEGLGIQTNQFLHARLRLQGFDAAAEAPAARRAQFRTDVREVQLELARRLAAAPGVRGVTMATHLPGMDHRTRQIELEGEGKTGDLRGHAVFIARVDVDFFSTFEQPILTGRGFDALDVGDDRSAVIVNTSFLDRVLGGRNPIGRRFRYKTQDEDPGPWFEIVGVVGHLGMNEVNPVADAGLYHPLAPGELNPVLFAIHLGDDPEEFTPTLRAIASEVDPNAMIQDPMPLNEVFSELRWGPQWGSIASGVLAFIALTLAASGLYALMSFTVSQRTREIGIRTALGAPSGSIVAIIARRALAQLVVGVLIGVAFSAWFATVVSHESEIAPANWPVVVTLVATVTVVVGLLACAIPTLRGLRIMPAEALRAGN